MEIDWAFHRKSKEILLLAFAMSCLYWRRAEEICVEDMPVFLTDDLATLNNTNDCGMCIGVSFKTTVRSDCIAYL